MSSSRVDSESRATFAAIADVLIPAAHGMPAASEVDVAGAPLDHALTLRPELGEAFRRGLATASGRDPEAAAEDLNAHDPEALSAIGLLASAIYYRDERVRALIGYPGQQSRPVVPEEGPHPFVAVVDRRGEEAYGAKRLWVMSVEIFRSSLRIASRRCGKAAAERFTKLRAQGERVVERRTC
ncbi:MAG: hypothetical protein AAGF49_10340, partial [Pseudomonadota bacterium]